MIRPLTRLLRVKLSLLNGVTAAGGYLLFPGSIDMPQLCALFSGVTLLAAGGSALNQVLERDLDRLMTRTSLRPLPLGQMSPPQAVIIGSSAVLAGVMLLPGSLLPALLGCAALVWYLAVYTPLKPVTSLALPAGALCGAFPPLIGWCSAGGHPLDFRVILLSGLLFLWQVPHFWLFQRRHEEDYLQAGFPLFRGCMKTHRNVQLTLWLVALMAGASLLPLFCVIGRPVSFWYIAAPLALVSLSLLSSNSLLFPCLNLFPIIVTVLLGLQK